MPPPPPDKAPLGAKPVLPAPTSSASTERAARIFERMLQRKEAEQPPSPAVAPEPPPRTSRRYSLALEVAGAAASPPPAHAMPDEVTSPGTTVTDMLPDRPPPGAPTVRPPARRKEGAAHVSQELLESTADNLMLVTDPDGSTAFDISIRDEVFDDLACRITIKDRRLVATFRVTDANLRRLLEAEAGRLRASLEERGLTVTEINVVEE